MSGEPPEITTAPARSLTLDQRLGLSALLFSALYLLSDAIEAIQGGFSDPQLLLTLVAEIAIPVIVLGLYAAQRPQIGRLGLISALAYAYAFVFFTGTVVYALLNHTSDYSTLSNDLGPSMTLHGAVMVFAGIGFGAAVFRAGVLPSWTGVALGAGVVLVAATQTSPEGVQLPSVAVRDIAFAGMGLALLRARTIGSNGFRGSAPKKTGEVDPTPVPSGVTPRKPGSLNAAGDDRLAAQR